MASNEDGSAGADEGFDGIDNGFGFAEPVVPEDNQETDSDVESESEDDSVELLGVQAGTKRAKPPIFATAAG